MFEKGPSTLRPTFLWTRPGVCVWGDLWATGTVEFKKDLIADT